MKTGKERDEIEREQLLRRTEIEGGKKEGALL